MSAGEGWRAPRVQRLDCGLLVGLVERRQAPVVSTVVCYRAGAAAEDETVLGVAHLLEHMMFKGSRRYGPGEIDRRTQQLGGDNNAFTGHDATYYQFGFAADRWQEALRIEADRMAGLRLDGAEIDAEREVVLEELVMLEDDPWDSLELEVMAAFYGPHPYGRPVLGRRATLERLGRRELAAFHRRHYRPANAVLVVVGDAGEEIFEEAERQFGPLGGSGGTPAAAERVAAGPPPTAPARVERRRGEIARLLVAFAAPAAAGSGYAELRVALTVLAGGRASRLHRLLVEERRLCVSVSAEIGETVGPGVATLACELLPGAPPAEVEELVLGELERLAGRGADDSELERARCLLAADWAFDRETAAGEAMATATALALFDALHSRRHLEQITACSADDAATALGAALAAGGPVLGWSLPASEPGAAG